MDADLVQETTDGYQISQDSATYFHLALCSRSAAWKGGGFFIVLDPDPSTQRDADPVQSDRWRI
jgi:hypothetical protein